MSTAYRANYPLKRNAEVDINAAPEDSDRHYRITIHLDDDQLKMLVDLAGSIGGLNPVREILDPIWNEGNTIVFPDWEPLEEELPSEIDDFVITSNGTVLIGNEAFSRMVE